MIKSGRRSRAAPGGCAFGNRRRVGPAQADPLKIRGSWVAPVSNWASIWLEKKDLARHFGKSYQIEVTRFAGTPPMITALAVGELDIADLAYPTLPIAIQNAGMDDLRVIADEFQDGAPGYRSIEFMVLADGPIKTVEELKGKVVATNTTGSAVDIAMRAMLRKHGLEDKRDYTIVEAPFSAMRAMLAEKKVGLIPAVLPFSLDPELKKISRTLFTTKDAIGVTQFSMLVARKSFIDKNRAALVDFMEDSLRIVRWYLDPTNHDAVAQIAAQHDQGSRPSGSAGCSPTGLLPRSQHEAEPRRAAAERRHDQRPRLGQIDFDVKTHSDLSLIEEAAKRLNEITLKSEAPTNGAHSPREETMRRLKLYARRPMRARCSAGAASAEPVKNPDGLGGAGLELGLDRAGEEGPRQAPAASPTRSKRSASPARRR